MTNNKLCVTVFISSLSAPISAQIVLDDTFGHQGALRGPDFAIGSELGQQHGGNLFHSFRDFNIHQGESATFSGPNSVNNIISRVTGGTASTINGLLRSTIPKAHFYFLNPAGIIFDKQASLDVQGAFHVSTADSLRFDDGSQFHASQPQNSLLTVASPQAFGFLTSPKPISVYSELTVPDTQTLSIIGGDINFIQGGVHALAGHIYLASTASAGEVPLNPETDFFDTMTELGDINLSEQSTVGNGADEFDGAQRIYIRGGRFYSENSVINAQALSRTGEPSQVVIQTRESVELQQQAVIATDSYHTTDAGHLTINTGHLMIGHDAQIKTDTQRGGAAGVIVIKANQVTMTDDAQISSRTYNQGGPSGDIQITAETIQMTGNSQIIATSRQTAQSAGQIVIVANRLQMADDATIDTSAFANAVGDGGRIAIETKTLEMMDRAWIMSSSFGTGQSGSIDINTDTFRLSEQSAIASSTFSQGRGGDVTIQVGDTFSITDAAVVTSGTEGQGSGGNVVLVLPADKITIADAANINSSSEAINVVTNEIGRMLEWAKQLGGEVDGSLLTGGGKPGQVYIMADKLVLESRAYQHLTEQFQFTDCPNPTAQNNLLNRKRRVGLSDAFDD